MASAFQRVMSWRADFAGVVEVGANTIRTHTAPSIAVLDEAARHGLRVFAGVPWPQHRRLFLIAAQPEPIIRRAVASPGAPTRFPSGHAADRTRQRNLSSVDAMVWTPQDWRNVPKRPVRRSERPLHSNALSTYVNYPPTEYLETPFFDVCAFNVFLPRRSRSRAYPDGSL